MNGQGAYYYTCINEKKIFNVLILINQILISQQMTDSESYLGALDTITRKSEVRYYVGNLNINLDTQNYTRY